MSASQHVTLIRVLEPEARPDAQSRMSRFAADIMEVITKHELSLLRASGNKSLVKFTASNEAQGTAFEVTGNLFHPAEIPTLYLHDGETFLNLYPKAQDFKVCKSEELKKQLDRAEEILSAARRALEQRNG